MLDRTLAGRTFRRVQGAALTSLLAPPPEPLDLAEAVESSEQTPDDVAPGGHPEPLPPVE